MQIVVDVGAVLYKLTRYANKARSDTVNVVKVGYSAPYAVYVHENLQSYHPYGQAKFLEQPMREMKYQLAAIVVVERKRGTPIAGAMLAAGDALLERSKQLVPVATGFLRDSGFVEVTNRGV